MFLLHADIVLTNVRSLHPTFRRVFCLQQAEALSISRSRLLEVEYSIRVTASAGALTSDVHVTLPVRIINFLSVDPTPSEPLLSSQGAYTRLIPYRDLSNAGSAALGSAVASATDTIPRGISGIPHGAHLDAVFVATLASSRSQHTRPAVGGKHVRGPTRISLDTPTCDRNPSVIANEFSDDTGRMVGEDSDGIDAIAASSESDSSMCSTVAHSSASSARVSPSSPSYHCDLGNLQLDDDAGSDDEIDHVVGTVPIDTGRFSGFLKRNRAGAVGEEEHMDRAGPTSCDSGAQDFEVDDSEAYVQDSFVDPISQHPVARQYLDCQSPRGLPYSTDTLVYPEDRGDEPVALHPYRSGGSFCSQPARPDGNGNTSIEASASTVKHLREVAGSFISAHSNSDDGDDDDDGGATPRLGPSLESRNDAIASSVPDTGSQLRPSRQLPKPPGRLAELCDIPASVSALESLRISHLSTSHSVAPGTADSSGQLGSRSGSTLSRSTAHRSLPTTPTRAATSGPSACSMVSRPFFARFETMPSSQPVAPTGTLRPPHALRQTGQSECSIVKGRIAALEQRLKHSEESGAAYA